MPNPKRRHSSSRQKKRRTHDKATPSAPYVDTVTGVEHRSHQICAITGFYRGKQVLTVKKSKASA